MYHSPRQVTRSQQQWVFLKRLLRVVWSTVLFFQSCKQRVQTLTRFFCRHKILAKHIFMDLASLAFIFRWQSPEISLSLHRGQMWFFLLVWKKILVERGANHHEPRILRQQDRRNKSGFQNWAFRPCKNICTFTTRLPIANPARGVCFFWWDWVTFRTKTQDSN